MRRRSFLIGLLALVQVFLLTFSSLVAAERWVSLPVADDRYVLLVMGSDQGPPRSGSVFDGRADAIQLVVVDEAHTHVSIVSIPRDSYVPVRGLGRTKINAMLTRGPENAVGTVEDLTGLDVDDWIVTSFNGFINTVTAFGGVNVNVEQRLYDPQGAHSDLQPGEQELGGRQALAYSRDRKSRSNGDFGRTAAQARMLRWAHRDLIRRVDSPTDLFTYLGALRGNSATSITPSQMTRLGWLALQIKPGNVAQQTLPGRAGTAGSASVVHLGGGAASIFAELRENGRLAKLE